MALVQLDALSRSYSRSDGEVRALESVTLAIDRGEFVGVTGPSGSGKSTLLHLLALLDTPSAGSYRLDGVDVCGFDDRERSRIRNRSIGLVFQAFQLIPHLTVVENVELPLGYQGMPRAERQPRARRALARVGLDHRLGHRPDELSGGEQQRAAIARAIVTEPDLLLADEPTGNLDEGATTAVLEILAEIHRRGTTLVVVTHNARVANAAERRVEMLSGKIASGGPAPRRVQAWRVQE